MNAMKDVIVIGGGVAGLIAARACARVGLNVTVLEASAAVGGAVASHTVAGLTLDSGAESFAVRKNVVR
jgi:oxygen-dependent protoporphyrinogen oxidase